MPIIFLKEFGCGHSSRTGTQIISWILMFASILGLYEVNFYYYETKNKKIKNADSMLLMLLIFNFVLGIVSSLSGLFGAYHNRRIWLKSLLVYLLCQFVILIIVVWIFFFLIYPEFPTNPKRTRFIILNVGLFGTVFSGVVMYFALIVYSYHKHISEEISGSEFLVPVDNENVLVHDDAFLSNMSSVSEVTARSYLTNRERHERFMTNFSPSTPVPEEIHSQNSSKELLINS